MPPCRKQVSSLAPPSSRRSWPNLLASRPSRLGRRAPRPPHSDWGDSYAGPDLTAWHAAGWNSTTTSGIAAPLDVDGGTMWGGENWAWGGDNWGHDQDHTGWGTWGIQSSNGGWGPNSTWT
ncbi:hypothetical protein C8R47DRAFT_1216262 [Mycena vitilis]|nr:hypothetical protein C8R47DRAFT_1216262 [Mycena vitilis]